MPCYMFLKSIVSRDGPLSKSELLFHLNFHTTIPWFLWVNDWRCRWWGRTQSIDVSIMTCTACCLNGLENSEVLTDEDKDVFVCSWKVMKVNLEGKGKRSFLRGKWITRVIPWRQIQSVSSSLQESFIAPSPPLYRQPIKTNSQRNTFSQLLKGKRVKSAFGWNSLHTV